MLVKKGSDLVKEHIEIGIAFGRNVGVSRQLDELGAWDQFRNQASFVSSREEEKKQAFIISQPCIVKATK